MKRSNIVSAVVIGLSVFVVTFLQTMCAEETASDTPAPTEATEAQPEE